jgi:hypothetical protein
MPKEIFVYVCWAFTITLTDQCSIAIISYIQMIKVKYLLADDFHIKVFKSLVRILFVGCS